MVINDSLHLRLSRQLLHTVKQCNLSTFVVLFFIFAINTIRKSHVCDHEPPIPEDEKIKLSPVMKERLLEMLRFKTISYEDRTMIDYNEFEQMWSYLKQEFKIIFENEKIEKEWVNQYTLILKIKGIDRKLKPGLFIGIFHNHSFD